MTSEERMKLYDDFHSGVRMMMDKVTEICKKKDSWKLYEIYMMADIMKDMADTEKSVAKAHYMYCEKSDESY